MQTKNEGAAGSQDGRSAATGNAPKGNVAALLPIGVFLVLYLGLGVVFEYVMGIPMGFYNIPIVVIFLVALLVTFLSEISAGAIAARTQMYRYGIYQLCGLSVKGCLGIHVRGTGMLTGIAFVLAVLGAWGMERFGWAVGGTVIRLGWMQAAGGLLVAAVNLAIACWIPLRIIRDRSVYETLYKEK